MAGVALQREHSAGVQPVGLTVQGPCCLVLRANTTQALPCFLLTTIFSLRFLSFPRCIDSVRLVTPPPPPAPHPTPPTTTPPHPPTTHVQICANACQSGYWFDLAYQDSSNSPWGQCRTVRSQAGRCTPQRCPCAGSPSTRARPVLPQTNGLRTFACRLALGPDGCTYCRVLRRLAPHRTSAGVCPLLHCPLPHPLALATCSAPLQLALPASSAATARGRRPSPKSPACRLGRGAVLSAPSAPATTRSPPTDSTPAFLRPKSGAL